MLRLRHSVKILEPYNFGLVTKYGPLNFSKLYSDVSHKRLKESKPCTDTSSSTDKTISNNIIKPWYLSNDIPRSTRVSDQLIQPINLPKHSCEFLIKITTMLRDKLGLEDIIAFDMSNSFSTAANKLSKYMVLSTAKSSNHISNSVIELKKYIKEEFETVPICEGGLTSNELRKRQRRINKRIKVSKNILSSVDVKTDWHLVDTKINGIFVNIMTLKRRNELNLEELYCTKEDMHLYYKPMKSNIDEEDNVLTGLRHLASKKSKRYYSTNAIESSTLYDSLIVQDFKTASDLVNNNSLYVIIDALSNLPSSVIINQKEWISLFESQWPHKNILDSDWSLRFKFYQLIYLSNLNIIESSEGIVEGTEKVYYQALNRSLDNFYQYFQLKQAMTGLLTHDELIQFLKLVLTQINLMPNYGNLSNRFNPLVIKVLKLYINSDPNVLVNPRITALLLQTMESKNANLHSLYEFIDFISSEFEIIPKIIADQCIVTLARTKNWPKLFQFWNAQLYQFGQDPNMWITFIKVIRTSDNKEIMHQILDKGHLLWLKRYNVKISPEIRLQLELLFEYIDPKSVRYHRLKDYLLN